MADAWLWITLALVATGVAGLAGGLFSEGWLRRHQASLVSFAAGALLAAVFLDILPESIDRFGSRALMWAFGGFVALAVVQWLLGHSHHHHHHDHHEHIGEHGPPPTLPATLLISDALHNLADGAAIAAAFFASPRAGLVVALGVVAHEIPQEVGDYALLRASGWRRGPALGALAAVQLTGFIGAFGVALAVDRFADVTTAVLSVAAGTFMYIGATDLLPQLHSGPTAVDRRERLIGFLAGVGLIAAASVVG